MKSLHAASAFIASTALLCAGFSLSRARQVQSQQEGFTSEREASEERIVALEQMVKRLHAARYPLLGNPLPGKPPVTISNERQRHEVGFRGDGDGTVVLRCAERIQNLRSRIDVARDPKLRVRGKELRTVR